MLTKPKEIQDGESRNPTSARSASCVAIVLNFNGRDLLRRCLDSLAQQTYENLTISVVDNGSQDGSFPMVVEEFPRVRFLRLAHNFGFCIANNVAIRDALNGGAEYVLLLNNDTVVAPDCVCELVWALETNNRIAAVSPKIYFADQPDTFWYAGGDFNLWTAKIRQRGWKQKDTGQFDSFQDVTVVTGCCMLLRAAAIRDVGLLDEYFWAYLEDVEWSTRFIKRGWKLRIAPKAHVWHSDGATWVHRIGKGSAVRRQFLSTRNMIFLAWKHARLVQIPSYVLGFLVNHVLFYSVLRIARRDYRALWGIYRGMCQSLWSLVGNPRWNAPTLDERVDE